MGINKTVKNNKGNVSIEDYRGRIRLRWRYQGNRYALSLFSFTKQNLLLAKNIAVSIENDLVKGTFDSTMAKYRVGNMVKSPLRAKSIVALFEEWALEYKNRVCEQHKNYQTVRNMMLRWEPFKASDILRKLNSLKVNERTYNRRLAMLKNFMAWLVKSKCIDVNYLEDVQPKKTNMVVDLKRKPFTESEITQILIAIRNDTFCQKNSGYKHSHYFPFLYFIFQTGVRNAEAVGLRVKNIHFDNGVIEIRDVLARSLKGTHASARIRKETKNGKTRLIPMTEGLRKLLSQQTKGKNREALVFYSPKGLAIDDRMFQRRVFRAVLKGLGIENRVLYACRHTFGSRCINEGFTPVMTAFLMGNNPETALRNYTHQISLPKNLPAVTVDAPLPR